MRARHRAGNVQRSASGGDYIRGAEITFNRARIDVRTSTWTVTVLALLATACAKQSHARPAADSTSVATTAAADTTKSISGMAADSDRSVQGNGVPAGYTALTDHADANITDAKYTVNGDKWDVQTGPAHIVYAAKDSGSGIYAVSATIEQLAKPRHPEAYGVFFGGQALDNRATQKYSYFLVRGTGEYLIKMRNGDKTSPVVNWTASPNIPKEDAEGKATYTLKVHFAKDTAHFLVNGKLLTAIPRSKLSTEGIAGLRINHNLHVAVTPVVIER